MFRRTESPPMSVRDLLESWGIEPDDEDAEPALFNGTISGVFGFIVVTQTRFCFVPATRTSKAVAVTEQHLLSDLLRIHTRRHRMRRSLFIEWRNTRTIVLLDTAQVRALYDLLSPVALIQSHDD